MRIQHFTTRGITFSITNNVYLAVLWPFVTITPAELSISAYTGLSVRTYGDVLQAYILGFGITLTVIDYELEQRRLHEYQRNQRSNAEQ